MNRRWSVVVAIGAFFLLGKVAVAEDVRGAVELRSGARVQYAKLTFCLVQTSTRCRTTFTGTDGKFSLVMPRGRYSVSVQSYQGKRFKTEQEQITIGSGTDPLRIVVFR